MIRAGGTCSRLPDLLDSKDRRATVALEPSAHNPSAAGLDSGSPEHVNQELAVCSFGMATLLSAFMGPKALSRASCRPSRT